MIKAVVFDMDGVIADTEPLHEKARNALLESLGLDVEQLSPQAIGRSKRSFWSEISQKFNLKESGDELTLREFDMIMRIAKESNLKPSQGMKELLEFLEREKIKAAVASSSDRNYVEKILALTDLGGYFCVTACGDEVPCAKPAPDVYLKALNGCGVNASEALAVEDSDTGARAAEAAGIPCIAYDAVEDERLRQSFNICSYKVKKISDIVNIIKGAKAKSYAI